MVLGGLICFAHAYFFETTPYIFPGELWPFIGYACAMALSQNIAAYNIHAYLLTQYTTTFLTFCCFLSSILAAFLGAVLLHEKISMHLIISAILVLAGLVIFYQEELKQGYIA